ncbi:WcaA Glycosyltransferases involved in cell wall biogenesis [Candidatus Nanopelagicaceae bacterium]
MILSRIKLSAIVPIRGMENNLHNLEHTLKHASVMGIEIVLIHDDAGDGTSRELNKLVDKYQNGSISFFESQVNSPGLARNIGIELARGEWICFWDSDDLPIPDAYLKMIAEAEKRNAEIAIGRLESISHSFENVQSSSLNYSRDFDYILNFANMPSFTRMAFRQHLVKDIHFPAFRMGEDQCFIRDSNFLNHPIFVSDETCYRYFTDEPGQLTRDPSALKELTRTVDYLASQLCLATGPMKFFSQAQFLKLFVSGLRNSGRIKWLLESPLTWIRAMKFVFGNPLKAWKIMAFLASNRIKLAGR